MIYNKNGILINDNSIETINEPDSLNENILYDVAKHIVTTQELKDQWKGVASKFVKHKWIYRYIDEKQKIQLEKHYAVLTDEKSFYSSYKRSFQAVAKFMGIPYDQVIIENMLFSIDKEDKEQWEVSIKYSKGYQKVKIPDGIRLIHVSPVAGIKELIPSFRSKVKGKYMYPNKRIFFTVTKDIKPNQAGLEGQKTYRYTPIQDIKECYIDPTYADYRSGAVYVETETPIPVESLKKKMFTLFGSGSKENKKEESKNDSN